MRVDTVGSTSRPRAATSRKFHSTGGTARSCLPKGRAIRCFTQGPSPGRGICIPFHAAGCVSKCTRIMTAIVPHILVFLALSPYLAPAVSWCCFGYDQAPVAAPAGTGCCEPQPEPVRTPEPSVRCCCEHDPFAPPPGVEVETVHAAVVWINTACEADAQGSTPVCATELAPDIPHRILHCVWRC